MAETQPGKPITYLHKAKCLKCGLHFIVCSWDRYKEAFYCPECGERNRQMRWIETSTQPVSMLVPGEAKEAGSDVIPEADKKNPI